MSKKKVEHVVFDGMWKIKKKINVGEYNSKTHSEKRKQTEKKHDNFEKDDTKRNSWLHRVQYCPKH